MNKSINKAIEALQLYASLKYDHKMGFPPEVQWVAENAIKELQGALEDHIHTFVFLRQNTVYIDKVKNTTFGTIDHIYELHDIFYCQHCLLYQNVVVDSYHYNTGIPYKEMEG
jgi:hypothetical protein